MNDLFKYLGVFILLIGVAVLAVPAIIGGISNTILLSGLCIIVVGYISHIIINKRVQ